MNKPMTASDMLSALKELTHLGLLEVEEQPNSEGVMELVWRRSPLGHLVAEYQQRLGITVEQALAKAKSLDPKSVD